MGTPAKRVSTLVAAALIADGAAFATNPQEQIRIWSSSRAPSWYRRLMNFLDHHTRLCRVLAGAELVAGAAILARISRSSPTVR